MRRLVLTFDVEDFVNLNEMNALHRILEMLAKYNLKALFFVTGHVAEKLTDFPEILDLLENHEIGFHSSGHSVHPTIPEYTDVKSYEQAYLVSLDRETSHINPLTGKLQGEGGIHILQDLFYSKKIEAFRAPGMSWTPPNLEALRSLGIRFDFSSNITNSDPIRYKGIIFYPYTFIQKWDGSFSDYQCFVYALLRRKVAVFDLHPTLWLNQHEWDSIYYRGNPSFLSKVPKRPSNEIAFLVWRLDLLLRRICSLQHAHLVATAPNLNKSKMELKIRPRDVQSIYEWSMRWPRNRFNYNPKFIQTHFYKFFEDSIEFTK